MQPQVIAKPVDRKRGRLDGDVFASVFRQSRLAPGKVFSCPPQVNLIGRTRYPSACSDEPSGKQSLSLAAVL
jgi:hypothetical protein